MATSDNKNQLTLYRFVSLRSPELSKKKDKEIRFVFHPDNRTGIFFDKVINKPLSQTKWEALQEAASDPGFTVFETESDVENKVDTGNDNFFITSDWISRNRSNFDFDELMEMIKPLKVLDIKTELNLWDNLFYQVVTQKSFYVKEALMQVLVLQNLLKQINGKDDQVKELLTPLVRAKVVLPVILFENEGPAASNSNKVSLKGDAEPFTSKELNDSHAAALSGLKIEDFSNTIVELKKVEKKYQKERQVAFNDANKQHQDTVVPIIKKYEKDYKALKRAMCDNPRDENYDPTDFCNQPDIEYPELPEFVFDYPKPTDKKYLEANLSENAFYVLTSNVDLDEIDTIQDAISILEERSRTESGIIFSSKQYSKQVMTIGGAVIPYGSSMSKASVFTFRICPVLINNNMVNFYMTIQVPNSTYSATSVLLTASTATENITDGYFVGSTTGNTINLTKLFGSSNGLDGIGITRLVTKLSGKITLAYGSEHIELDLLIDPFNLKQCFSGSLTSKDDGGGSDGDGSNGNNNSVTDSFIPKGFGYRQLGIADYKKVVAEVCCYEPGEVAHIENVMASELRSKVTTKTEKSEVTDFESTEVEKENMTDVVSTQRFEMQTEVSKLLSEQKSLSAYADVHTSWPNTTLDAGMAYASNTTKEESNRQAVTQAKELTQRAVERIVSRVKKEKTVKITNEFTETNTHVFDNTGGDEHISGIFRFINAIYKNQVFNYGKRLMYEFTVPQPSELHRLAMEVANNNENATVLEKPIDPATLGIKSFTDITSLNYQSLASKYNAEVDTYPQEIVYLNKTFSGTKADKNEILEGSAEIQIEKGYKATTAYLKFTAKCDNDGSQHHTLVIAFGNYSLHRHNSTINLKETDLEGYLAEYPLTLATNDTKGFINKVDISYASLNYLSFNIAFTVKTELTTIAKEEWKKKVYEAIQKGYQEQLREYNEKLTVAKEEGSTILDSNPLFYRQIEQLVLRKNCISYLLDNSATSLRRFGRKMYTGDNIKNHQVTASQDMDDYGSFAKFMEQAFEWNLMSYNFYPYYWGYDDDWAELYQYETNDPIFRSFMQAGMARVVVTVKPGFEDAIMHYMTTGQIWNGGQTPIIGDPLYLSIVDELKEQEYTVEETWKTVVPTNLIGLQRKGVSVAEDGLPCSCPASDELNEKLVANGNILKPKA